MKEENSLFLKVRNPLMEVVLNFTKGLEHEVSRPGLKYHSENHLSVILHKEYLNSLIDTLFITMSFLEGPTLMLRIEIHHHR